jgi:hypothetical protein
VGRRGERDGDAGEQEENCDWGVDFRVYAVFRE